MAPAKMTSTQTTRTRSAGWPGVLVWCGLAALTLFAVLLINGVPLFYHDTAGYFGHGEGILRVLGLFQPDAISSGAGIGTSPDTTNGDGIVIGSRSAIYAIFVTVLTTQATLWAPVIAQGLLLAFTTWLTCHYALKLAARPLPRLVLTAQMLIAGAIGAAGFYVAYLMPDIFAPILLICMAALVAFAPVLGFWGAAAFTGLGIMAVVMHPSHLAISLVLILPCVLLGYLFQTGRALRTLMLLALIPASGIAERQLFNFAVERSSGGTNQVVYLPFFTARLISDGPGLAYLAAHCPSPTWATCDLYDEVRDQSYLSPDHILFSTSDETGSFALLTPEQQRDIAWEQSEFLRATLLSRPLGVGLAALGNTIEQLGLVSPAMTIPDPETLTAIHNIYPDIPNALDTGRLIMTSPPWMPALIHVHQIYYVATGLLALALILLPGSRVHINLRIFGLLVFAGLLANAFVTGAISQPADRYGARVIFLVPMLAILLLALRAPKYAARTDTP